jgi:cyclic dehypoxanthinyl futalosine synthase
MNVTELLNRALKFEFLSIEEGVFLYENAPTAELMFVGNELKKIQKKN